MLVAEAVEEAEVAHVTVNDNSESQGECEVSQNKGHIQTRTCVVCRERRPKETLLRVVRTPEGRVVIDKTGRMNGRGAYVCGDVDHWGAKLQSERIDRGRLKQALKTDIDDATVNRLSEAFRSHHDG